MRSTLVAAAFAAGVLAVPFNERRAEAPSYGDNVQTDVEVVYVTQVVTVTADGDAPAYTPEAPHYGHKHSKQPVTTTTYEVPAPAYTPETTPEAPAYTPETAPEAPAYTPETTPEAPSNSAPAPSPPAPASGSYQDTCLYHHNIHRSNHTAPALAWSDALTETARKIAEKCVYAHDVEVDGGGYGQNMAAGVPADNISAVITDLFYNGEEPLFAEQYGREPDMDNFHLWGHFTQLVWHGTTEVGCFTADCSATGLGNTGSGVSPYFTICNYKGPGNFPGEYQKNVNPPKKEPTANWDTGRSGVTPSGYKK